MIYEVFAFFDTKAEVFSQPFYSHNSATAIRIATERCADPQDIVGRHPADFTLFRLGSFDDNTGKFDAPQPVSICACLSLVPRSEGAPLLDRLRSPL